MIKSKKIHLINLKIIIFSITLGIIYGILNGLDANHILTVTIGVILLFSALSIIPLWFLGNWVGELEKISMEEAKEWLKTTFVVVISSVILLILGILFLGSASYINSFLFIYWSILFLFSYVALIFLKKNTMEKICTYDRMFDLLIKEKNITENIVETYLEKNFFDFGHKMFKNMSNEDIIEDFKTYRKLVIKIDS